MGKGMGEMWRGKVMVDDLGEEELGNDVVERME